MYDWVETHSRFTFEREFDLRFDGPGWYNRNHDWMLVVPTNHPQRFDCFIWVDCHALELMRAWIDLPVRRKEPSGEREREACTGVGGNGGRSADAG